MFILVRPPLFFPVKNLNVLLHHQSFLIPPLSDLQLWIKEPSYPFVPEPDYLPRSFSLISTQLRLNFHKMRPLFLTNGHGCHLRLTTCIDDALLTGSPASRTRSKSDWQLHFGGFNVSNNIHVRAKVLYLCVWDQCTCLKLRWLYKGLGQLVRTGLLSC